MQSAASCTFNYSVDSATFAQPAVCDLESERAAKLQSHPPGPPIRSMGKIEGDSYILSEDDKRLFEQYGFIKLDGVVTEEELQKEIDPWFYAYLRREIQVPGKDVCDMSGAKGRTPDEFTVYNVMLPRTYNPAQQGNILEKRCKSIADQLHGGDMEIDYDQILAKRPNSADAIFAWHQDMAYWPPLTSSTATATCWLAVTPSTKQNGCMRFIKGSHKEPELRKHAPVGATREESHALYTRVVEEEEDVQYVELPRGSITVHNERVVHGSGPNLSEDWRNGYVLAYRKAECIMEERSWGFTHSHNDTHSWDAFNKWTKDEQ